jgi:hypothetical protein
MRAAMNLESIPRHTVICHARAEAFALQTKSILARMGYALWTAEDYASRPDAASAGPPDALVVDERRLAEVAPDLVVPIVLLTGSKGASGADPRVVAAVKRPAGLHDLYRVLQQLLEDTPRTIPRVATDLPVSCRRRGQEWKATICSLSENGCLLRSPEEVPLGSLLQLRFELPGAGSIDLEAEAAYQLLPDLGLVFSATPPALREALRAYVEAVLA